MCVAVLVEKKDPSPDEIRAMARQNPHGGGLAWTSGELVHYRRGLSASDVISLVSRLPRPYFLHFRIATRGKAIPELTHPFPTGFAAITSAEELTGLAGAVVMHNGTWSDYVRWIPGGIDRDQVSDTQIAAYFAGWHENILDEVGWSNAIMRAAGSGRADITLRGQWTEHNGNMYSNLHWQRAAGFDTDEWEWLKGYRPYGYSPRAGSRDIAVDIARDIEAYNARNARDSIARPRTRTRPDIPARQLTPGEAYSRELDGKGERKFAAIEAKRAEREAKKDRHAAKRARRAARLASKRASDTLELPLGLPEYDGKIDPAPTIGEVLDAANENSPADTQEIPDLVDLMERAEQRCPSGLYSDGEHEDTQHLNPDWNEIDKAIRDQGIKV